MRRVLIVRFSSLGDITLTLPSVEFLVSQGHEVHYLTKAAFRPLLEAHGLVAQVHTISNHASLRELFGKTAELRELGFDMVYDLHRNIRSRIVSLKLGAPVRRVSKFRLKEILTFSFKRRGLKKIGIRPIQRALAALQITGGVRFQPGRPFRALSTTPAEVEKWLESRPGGYACIAPESAWPQKEWKLERFAEIARKIESQGFGVMWIGLKPLPAGIQTPGAINTMARLSLSEVISVIGRAKLVVCNDSGLMHIAEAQGVPVIALFGPTSEELGFAPRLPESRIVQKELWCRPCSKTGRWCIRPIEKQKCLNDISVADVTSAVEAVLGEKKGSQESAIVNRHQVTERLV